MHLGSDLFYFKLKVIHCAIMLGGFRIDRNMLMPIGTVKWFNSTKAFCFIQSGDCSNDVFLHISDVQRSGLQEPRESDKLEYNLVKGRQGKVSAGNLRQA
jgi:CspA family cold shock protein